MRTGDHPRESEDGERSAHHKTREKNPPEMAEWENAASPTIIRNEKQRNKRYPYEEGNHMRKGEVNTQAGYKSSGDS
jgi:hypothetical protein